MGSKYTKENTNKLIETTVFFPTKWAACHYQVKHAVHKFIIQYYWYQPSMAACAAARRAMGTRNGEQLT